MDAAQDRDRFIEEMERQLSGWKDPVARLLRALEQDELELYAQPILALASPGRFPMAEVLVRLREGAELLLPAGMFLPAFEHYGMMPELDRWVVRNAIARVSRSSRTPRLFFNISVQTTGDAAFVRQIATELADAKVPPGAIAFEVSEQGVSTRPHAVKRFASAARKKGFGLVLSGFGRGASFAPLKALRPDCVKMDGTIVRNLLASEIARQKADAIVRASDAMGIRVVGEFVENDETLSRLRVLGAHYVQGFAVHPPAPLDDVLRSLDSDPGLPERDLPRRRSSSSSSRRRRPSSGR